MVNQYPGACVKPDRYFVFGISFSLVAAQMQASAHAEEKGNFLILVPASRPFSLLNKNYIVFEVVLASLVKTRVQEQLF